MRNTSLKYRFTSFLLIAFICVFTPMNRSYALDVQLLMLEQVGCYWCTKWKKEIGPIYPKTSEAKIAPLRNVDINEPWPKDLKNIAIDHFTPTFVVVNEGKEVGRIRGYAGDEFFWTLLDELLNKLPNPIEFNNSN